MWQECFADVQTTSPEPALESRVQTYHHPRECRRQVIKRTVRTKPGKSLTVVGQAGCAANKISVKPCEPLFVVRPENPARALTGASTSTKKEVPFDAKKSLVASLFIVCTCIGGTLASTSFAQKATVPIQPDTVAIASEQCKELLAMMDTDKNGKISKQEWMNFMEKEFDRLASRKVAHHIWTHTMGFPIEMKLLILNCDMMRIATVFIVLLSVLSTPASAICNGCCQRPLEHQETACHDKAHAHLGAHVHHANHLHMVAQDSDASVVVKQCDRQFQNRRLDCQRAACPSAKPVKLSVASVPANQLQLTRQFLRVTICSSIPTARAHPRSGVYGTGMSPFPFDSAPLRI